MHNVNKCYVLCCCVIMNQLLNYLFIVPFTIVIIYLRFIINSKCSHKKSIKSWHFSILKVYHKIDICKNPWVAKMQITVNCPPNCNSYIIHDKWLTKQQSEYRIQALQSVRDVPRQWQWCISPLKLFLICDIVVFPCVSLKNIKSFSRHGLWFIYIVYILIPYCHAVTLP